jgi:hypothetical protein
VAIGRESLYSNTTGGGNVAVGNLALNSNTTASNLVAIGRDALKTNTTGNYNTAIGYQSLLSNTTASNNTAVGYQAGYSTTASQNTAVGYQAGYANTTGVDLTAIGYKAGAANTTGSYNTFVGKDAGLVNTTGVHNTFIGEYSGRSTTGSNNTFLGQQSGQAITSGAKNTIIGRYTGNSGGLDIRTSDNNIVLADGDGNVSLYKNASGHVFLCGKTSTTINELGHTFEVAGSWSGTTSDDQRASIMNRTGTDGDVIEIRHDGTVEGTISVSGSTVSYNGGHLARWSQLPDNTRDNTLLKGTVLTNLDQMAVWGDEDNEQLNCTEKSSVEGDPNVAGVFVNWDNDDDIYTNDMNIAMTGDMIIRIAQGTTVARGNLLMSAGDGTAKPQGDDIVRSKTIAKVTSTHVTCTYDDGSYCVPCVLMAC